MSTGGPGHVHAFDPISGWCAYCNYRNDGRLISKDGDVWRSESPRTDQSEPLALTGKEST